MKEDIPVPSRPPRKRYQLENQQRTPDLWLASWANNDRLPESERVRVQAERARRKQLRPHCVVGVLVDKEDATPDQLEQLKAVLVGAKPTEIHHPWTTRRVAGALRKLDVPVTAHREMRDVVLAATRVIAIPRAPEYKGDWTPAWEAVRYSRHRNLPITVVLPDGSVA